MEPERTEDDVEKRLRRKPLLDMIGPDATQSSSQGKSIALSVSEEPFTSGFNLTFRGNVQKPMCTLGHDVSTKF